MSLDLSLESNEDDRENLESFMLNRDLDLSFVAFLEVSFVVELLELID